MAEAERRLAVYDQFQREALAVLSKAMAAAQEMRARAEAEARLVLDRARLEAALVDEAVARLRASDPELARRLAALREALPAPPVEGEVESLRKRLEIYESFEDTIQSVLTEALRAAHEIRTRSEEEASQSAERARGDTRALHDELARLRAERDGLSAVVDELRRARDALSAQREEADSAVAEMRSQRESLERDVASLRGEVARLREERPESVTAASPIQEELQRDLTQDIERLRAERVAMARERDYQSEEVTRLRAERDAVAQQLAALREAFAAALQQLVRTVAQPPLGAQPQVEAAAPAAPAAPAPEPTPAAAQASEQNEIRVVIAPVGSFSALVDLERRLQGFAGIRSVYVRDFRSGVATLACNIGHAMSMQDLADMLARELGATVERVAEGVIELKAKTEGGSALKATAG